MSFAGKWVEAATADTRQAAWYIGLFGKPESTRGGANVTEEGVKPNVKMRWRRERLDDIIAEEGEELGPLLGRAVKSWRELIDAIDWSWVLKRVEEMADTLKPWIGPKRASDAEREGLMRKIISELALFVHFVEARKGMDDGRWREERIKRLAMAVEELSGGRIAGNHAEELARAIIYYAEGYKKYAEGLIESLAEKVGVSTEEMRGVVKRVLSGEDPYVYCLAKDCANDKIIRKFVAPALELIMLDKALNGMFSREEALLRFCEMYATALAGDGHMGRRSVELAVGGELGGGSALLRLAALHLLNQLLPNELKFNARIYVGEGRYYRITATGEDAARLKRLLAVTAPSAGGEYLSEKFNEFVKETQVEVRPGDIRLTKSGVAADLTISEAGAAVKYSIYLWKEIMLEFQSTDRDSVELAAHLLRLAGISTEVKKKMSNREVWRIWATTDMLAAGRMKLRDALVKIVETARSNGWVDEKKAKRWLEKLKSGLTLMEGWQKYEMGHARSGALEVRYRSINPDSIERERQRFRAMGLEEGVHFTVKMPEGGGIGYVNIRRKGLEHAAWLSVHGSEEQRKLAAEFVNYILQRSKEASDDVYEKVKKIVDEGRTRGSLTLKGFEKEVELGGKEHVVKVIDGEAERKESEGGKKLLRIRITAEVDRVRSDYTITYARSGRNNAAVSYTAARANTPGGREADAERLSALIKALTGEEPKVYHTGDGRIIIECSKKHLDGFKHYAELADDIEKWLGETSRRRRRTSRT
ncbi:PaRep2b protein [Pyrobaculum sp. WP30]|nr:PaRep2b protein [Pyrobaculum sp. WP30]